MLRVLLVLVFSAACGGGGSQAPADAPIGSSPVTCDLGGASASGMLIDGAAVAHPFGPNLIVTWRAPQTGVPGSITLDDETTKITLDSVGCTTGNCPPPVGEYTDASVGEYFQAPWIMNSVSAKTLDVIVDVAPSMDGCWGGRFDIVYSADLGPVSGEIKGWWVNH